MVKAEEASHIFDEEREWSSGGQFEVSLSGNQVERLGNLGIEFLPDIINLVTGNTITITEPHFEALERVGKQKSWGYQVGGVIKISEKLDLDSDTPLAVKKILELAKKAGINGTLGVIADQESLSGVRFEAGTSKTIDIMAKGIWALFGKELINNIAKENGWNISEPKTWKEAVDTVLQQALTQGEGLDITSNWRVRLDKIAITKAPMNSGPDGVSISLKSEFVKGENWIDWLQKNAKSKPIGENQTYEFPFNESKWLKQDPLSDIGVVLNTEEILSELRPKEQGDRIAKIKAKHRKSLQDWFDHDEQTIVRAWRSTNDTDELKQDSEILRDYYLRHPIQDESLEPELHSWLETKGKKDLDRTTIHEFLVERGVVEEQIDDCIDFITGNANYIQHELEEIEASEKLNAKTADLIEKLLSFTDISRDLIPGVIRSVVNSGLDGRDLAQISLPKNGKLNIRIR